MVAQAALGIAVIGPEGAAAPLLAGADLVARSITEALDLLLEPRALAASLPAEPGRFPQTAVAMKLA